MTAATARQPASDSVVTALYMHTKTLHMEAEKTGVIRDLLRGDASRDSYVLLLRNLLPAYHELETGLEQHRDSAALGVLAGYDLDRSSAIASDLEALHGANWARDIPMLPSGEAYARRMKQAAAGDGTRLIAHAYTRYLGDLSGGQILQRLLTRSLALTPNQLSFYDFGTFADPAALKADYRKALDDAGALAADKDAVIEEGAVAFSLNIDLSCDVEKAMRERSPQAAAE